MPDRPAKQIKEFDQAAMKEGITVLKRAGSAQCMYIVGVDGRAKDITADCTVPDMAPYVVRIDRDRASGNRRSSAASSSIRIRIKQVVQVRRRRTAAVDPRGEKAPRRDQRRAQKPTSTARSTRSARTGTCNVKFTVGADGKPKDIVPDCTPPAFDSRISDAVKKMKYEPGQKGGKPVDWPNMTMPLNLTQN